MEISENMARIAKEAIGENKGEIVVYQPDEITRLEVKVNEDTVWLTQTQIARLFGVGQPAISKHLKNIFASGELDITAVYSILEYTAADGKSYKTGFYNLDAILSIGYRVNSRRATSFRQWANTILKEYLIRGLSFNARLLQLSADIDRRLTTHAIKLNEHEKKPEEMTELELLQLRVKELEAENALPLILPMKSTSSRNDLARTFFEPAVCKAVGYFFDSKITGKLRVIFLVLPS